MTALPSGRRYAPWLALVRIVTGAMWVAHGIPKFIDSGKFMPPTGAMSGFITQATQSSTGPYHDFLVNVVTPNIALFAELVRLGEVLVGVSLILGALTPVGAFFGIVLSVNYIAAKGHVFSSATLQGLDFAMLVLSAISLVMPTGRFFGVDGLFGRARRDRVPIHAEFVPEPPLRGPAAPPNP